VRIIHKDWLGAGFVAVLGLAILIFVPVFLDLFEVLQMTKYVVLALFVLSLAYIWGFGGILSFGQAGFFGLGGYIFAVSSINMGQTTIPFLIAIALCALFAGALGYFMFYGRLNDVYLGVVTLVVTLILYKLMNHTAGPEYIIGTARLGGFNGIPSIPIMTLPWQPDQEMEPAQMFQYFMAILIAVYLLLHVLLKSKFGRVAISIRENEVRTGLLGYDVRLYKLCIFMIGGAIGGAAGAMWASYQTFVDPNIFSLEWSAKCLIWVIAGGVGTLIGPIIGVIALEYLSFQLGQTDFINNLIVLGTILILVVLLMPKGLFPTFRDVFLKLWRWGGGQGDGERPG
jgi:branched-chain amino acid transport system permease protein